MSARRRSPARRAPAACSRRRAPPWTRLGDAELLKLRFRELGLRLDRTRLQRRLGRLHAELERRGIAFKPHAWLAEEWFSPDGVPGIAIPFYLAHPRLERLERRMMREVEGGNADAFMRILRHEAGHALDTAYRLRRRSRWREVFGPASLPYPDRYRARPGSRRYVQHLGDWYAQAHPTEDFAETFAVWLKPNSPWRNTYAAWPAFAKLALVDELMREVGTLPAAVRSRARIEPIDQCDRTLGEYYRRKLLRYRHYRRGAMDELLRKIFAAERPAARRRARRASALLRAAQPQLVEATARAAGVERYSVEQIVRRAVERCEHFELYVRGSRRDSLRNVRWMLVHLVNLYSQGESPQIAL